MGLGIILTSKRSSLLQGVDRVWYNIDMTYKDKMAEWSKQREDIAQLHAQGLSIRDIARKLRVTDSAVWARLNRYKNEKPNQSL